jgi:DNA-binding transcriptional regulator LsrR (DeoR family)
MPQSLSELVLITRVARAYYLDGQSRVEIADSLDISRFRVARMLEAARRRGIVHIEIHAPGIVNTQLSVDLQNACHLRHAIVLDVPADDVAALRTQLGRTAGQLLTEVAGDGDVIGLSWARSLAGIYAGVGTLSANPIVQMTGAISRLDGSDVIELVRSIARSAGGPAHVFYAPMIVEDNATARALRRQPDVARALKLVDEVTVAMVGIGAWRAGQSTIYDSLSSQDRERTADAGVVAEVSGILVGADGSPIAAPLSRRAICPTGSQLQAIPNVLAVAYGVEKADGVRSVLKGALVNGLVTHTAMAEALLARD